MKWRKLPTDDCSFLLTAAPTQLQGNTNPKDCTTHLGSHLGSHLNPKAFIQKILSTKG